MSDGVSNPRGWDALEIKLKAKGLSAGEISQARKSFYDGMETLTKMFLQSCSVQELDSRFRGNDKEVNGNDSEKLE